MATVDSILSELGSASRSASNAASTPSSALGKDDFLELLVVQLQNQDPLNPLDDKEFIAQLAQFSSLEQMSNVASGIEALTKTVSRQDSLSAVSYIGKNVVAEGNTVSKLDSGITPVYFTLSDSAATVSINVYDQNNNIVKTETLNSMQEGEYTFSWDGLDYNGKKADNGQYKVYFAAVDANDRAVLVDTKVVGTITGVSKTSDDISFRLSDGRTVQFDDISMVTQGLSAE
jgi:flagellar basal-body rod modification protein FlgD